MQIDSQQPKKKCKDRERRKSLIQAITGLFGKKEEAKVKEDPKEADSKKSKDLKRFSKGGSVREKFSILKLSPRNKSKVSVFDGAIVFYVVDLV